MKKLFLIIMIFLPNLLFSQGEIRINSFINYDQRDPHIVSDSHGNFLVVWTSYNQVNDSSKHDIYFQTLDVDLNKIGNETLVNESISDDQIRPAVAMNESGDFIIAWASYTDQNSLYDIKAKLYKNGVASTNEFLVNTVTLNSQTKPSADIFSDGSFIIVWESWFEDGSDRGIFAQKFFNDGSKNGYPFQVNQNSQFSQSRPVVKFFQNGNFIIVWETWKQDYSLGSNYDIMGRIFNNLGDPITNEIQINDYSLNYQWYADVITLSSQDFIVGWCSWEQDGEDGGIYLKKFNNAFNPLTSEILVNSYKRYYQWLPKLAQTPLGNIVVVWSSWQQDGSREGVYSKLFDSNLNEKSFEERLNDITENFQWEPTVVAINDNEIITTWSNYDESLKSYDIIAKRNKILTKEAVVKTNTYEHISGLSTTRFLVNVIDSTKLNGHTYELSFNIDSLNKFYAIIKDINSFDTRISKFVLDQGENAYYLTPIFDGIAIEINPIFDLRLDFDNSGFKNNSGSNINFNIVNPSGETVIAPIDIAVEWGDSSKNPDGSYVFPLDSAYSSSGKIEIKTPFRAWDITNNEKLFCYVVEPTFTKNKQWDPGESILVLTPSQYQHSFPDFHVQINSSVSSSQTIYPTQNDSIFIYTQRPLTTEDIFTFSTKSQNLTSILYDEDLVGTFELKQNYPNPFNPSTTISFNIPKSTLVKLKVFNLLGELITVLKDEILQKGHYRINFNPESDGLKLASGIYFYSLEIENFIIAKKMLFLK
jgi:hypothetical protein